MSERIMRASKVIAVSAIVFSLPLFFSYQIKHILFPPGYLFVFMYSAGLLSVLLVPVLLIAELVLIVIATKRREVAVRWWHIVGLIIAGLAESVFLVARQL